MDVTIGIMFIKNLLLVVALLALPFRVIGTDDLTHHHTILNKPKILVEAAHWKTVRLPLPIKIVNILDIICDRGLRNYGP